MASTTRRTNGYRKTNGHRRLTAAGRKLTGGRTTAGRKLTTAGRRLTTAGRKLKLAGSFRKLTNGRLAAFKKMYATDKRKLAYASAAIMGATKDAKQTFTNVEDSVEKYVKKNPWKTMGFSLLAGVVIAELYHINNK